MLANLNSLSIKIGLASSPVEVLEYRMEFASGPVEVPEQGDRFDMALVLFCFLLTLRNPSFINIFGTRSKIQIEFWLSRWFCTRICTRCFVFDSLN